MRSKQVSILLGIKSLLSEPIKIQIVTVSDSEGIEAVEFHKKNEKQAT